MNLDLLGMLVNIGRRRVDHGLLAAGDAAKPGIQGVHLSKSSTRACGDGSGEAEADLHGVGHVGFRTHGA